MKKFWRPLLVRVERVVGRWTWTDIRQPPEHGQDILCTNGAGVWQAWWHADEGVFYFPGGQNRVVTPSPVHVQPTMWKPYPLPPTMLIERKTNKEDKAMSDRSTEETVTTNPTGPSQQLPMTVAQYLVAYQVPLDAIVVHCTTLRARNDKEQWDHICWKHRP